MAGTPACPTMDTDKDSKWSCAPSVVKIVSGFRPQIGGWFPVDDLASMAFLG